MKNSQRVLVGIVAFSALVFLSFAIIPIILPTANLAQAVAPVPKDEQNPELGIIKVQARLELPWLAQRYPALIVIRFQPARAVRPIGPRPKGVALSPPLINTRPPLP
jgi:hypothetical protein